MPFALDDAALDLLFREAHTPKTFTGEPVGEDAIRAVYDLIKLAPTAFNQSPLRLTLLRSPEARQRLLPQMSPGNQAKTATAPMTVILSVDLEFHRKLPTLFPAVPGLKDGAFAEPAARERSGGMNATLQAGYFLLGLRAAGLAAGPMTGFDAEGINKEFFGDGSQRVLLVVNAGKPGPDAYRPRGPRLSFEEAAVTL